MSSTVAARTLLASNINDNNVADITPADVRGVFTAVLDALDKVAPSILQHGATGNGTTDDRAAFATAEASSSTPSISLPAGTYRIASNLTITKVLTFAPGAILKPDSGVTVTLSGQIDAGLWKIFDTSSGGSFVGPVGNPRAYPQWFGGSPAIADNTTAIQAALSTGLDVSFSPGDWSLTGPVSVVTNGQRIVGAGSDCRILSTSLTNDIFRIGNGSDNIRGVVFRDLRIYSTVVKTAGVALRFRKASYCDVVNCMISHADDFEATGVRLWDGVSFEEAADCVVSACSMWGFGQDGIRIYGGVLHNAEISVSGGTWITYAKRYGIGCLGRFGGLRLSDGDISACWKNICIDQSLTPGFPNREVFVNGQFSIDAAASCNVWIGQQAVGIVEFNGAWVASAGHTTGVGPDENYREGIHIDPNNSALTMRITGGKIFNNKGCGVTVNSGQVLIQGVHFTSNGSGLGASGHAFWMPASAGNAGPIQLTDCTFEGSAGYDVRIDNALANSRITDNLFRGGSAGTFSAPSNTTSGTNIVQRNIGYRTQAAGTSNIASGQTSVAVSHGLPATPTSIQITPLNTAPEGGAIFITTATATTFTASISSSAAAARDFYWVANLGAQI